MENTSSRMLLVGLGNPGDEYTRTPHNMGREVVEYFAAKHEWQEFKSEKKFHALISENVVSDKKVIVALPETFMNVSGEAVAAIAAFYKIPSEYILVVHDEADLPLGNIRVDFSASSAGHNGVASIIEKLGTKDFWRFRVGIGPKEPLEIPLEAYVLKKGAIPDDTRERIFEKASTLIEAALTHSSESATTLGD